MENSQPLATESFSYGWLTNKSYTHSIFHDNSSQTEHNFDFDIPFTNSTLTLVHADEIFYDGHIMPVYDETPQLDALRTPSTSISNSPMVSRNSFVEPGTCIASRESLITYSYYEREARIFSRESLDYSVTRFFDHNLARNLSNNRRELHFLGKWRKSSKRLFENCFSFVKPFRKTVGCSMKSSRVNDLEREVCEIQSWSNSLEASPRTSSEYSVVECTDVTKIGSKFDLDLGIKKVKRWKSSPKSSPLISTSRSRNSSYEVESSIHEAITYCKRSIGMPL